MSNDELKKILLVLASSDPDFQAFADEYAQLPHQTTVPDDLVIECIALLEEDENYAPIIGAMKANPAQARSFFPSAEISTVVAIAFVLRTHIKIKKSTSGKWEILFEHKPMQGKALASLIAKLSAWLNQGQ